MNDYVDTLPTILDDKKIQKIDDCKLYYVYKKLLSDFNMNINIFKDELIRRNIPFDDDDTGYDLKNVIIRMFDEF
jgi:hypothetical protein